MTVRRFAVLVPVVALLAAVAYVFVYIYRWEWHRALVVATFVLALEVGLGVALVLHRLATIERLLTSRGGDDERTVLRETRDALRSARPPAEPFAWLTEASNRTSVFVPILLGTGVVLSALAWLVERVARAVAGPTVERSLSLRLQPLTVADGALTDAGARRATPGGRWSLPALSDRATRWEAIRLVIGGVVPLLLVFGVSSTRSPTGPRTALTTRRPAQSVRSSSTSRTAPSPATPSRRRRRCGARVRTRPALATASRTHVSSGRTASS